MHAALLFPAVTDPRSPHLALPSLAGALRAAGVRTTLRDLDLEGLLWLIEPTRVVEAVTSCESRLTRTTDAAARERLLNALEHAPFIVESIGAAPDLLRDDASFYDPHVYYTARECIVRALELVSVAAGPVQCSTGPVQYDVDGFDASRLEDLVQMTADPRLNLYDQFYRESVLPALAEDRPDLVGISILNFQQVVPGLALARLLKAAGHCVVLGGTVYTKFVPELLARPLFFETFCDGVIAYEGETALLELLAELDGKRRFDKVPNFLHLGPGSEPTMGRTHVENVDALPTPDFDGLPLDLYLAPEPVLPILTGKGCYFNRCKFCDIPFANKVANKAYRVRSPERIAADVHTLYQRHGARHFEITDEALAPRLLEELAEALETCREVEPRFVGYARLEPGFTPEVCRRIHAMGMRKLFFGLESGSQHMLDHMDKGIRVDTARQVLGHCVDAGIAFHIFSIVGFPEETEEMARETLQFFLDNQAIVDLPRNSLDIHPFTLDLRTDYSDHAATFGVDLDAGDLVARDFPLDARRWLNARGMDEETVAGLVAEFAATLRQAFPDFRQYPAHLWPGFEEHSLLYCTRYEHEPFQFRFTLPPAGDPRPYGLAWADSVGMEPIGDDYAIRCLTGAIEVHKAIVMLLATPPAPAPVGALVEALVTRAKVAPERRVALEQALRRSIDQLLQIGALRLQPANGDSQSEASPESRASQPKASSQPE